MIKLPWDIVVCSDAELQRLADQRLAAFEQAQARLGPAEIQQLREDQTAWVHSYSASCGIRRDRAPPSPIPAKVVECFKRAGKARLAYLRAYAPEEKTPDAPVLGNPRTTSPATQTPEPPASAHADHIKDYTGPFTTKFFYAMCSRDDRISRDKCEMYIQGLMYGLNVSRSIQGIKVCLPNMSTKTARLRIIQFIDGITGGKPETNGDGGDWMAFMGLSTGNVCKQ